VMRRARFDPKARGIDCAVKRDNVIGAKDQRTTQGNPSAFARDSAAFERVDFLNE
jgi:hypothetical protein